MDISWKDVMEFNGLYEISNTGLVKSNHKRKSKLLKLVEDTDGYLFVCLRKNNKNHNRRVHRLVAEHFLRSPSNDGQVNHIDGNKKNNSAKNLEWVTPAENTAHAITNGLSSSVGVDNGMAKLSEEQVVVIVNMEKKTELTHEQIAARFNVSQTTVSRIISGESWSHVTEELR